MREIIKTIIIFFIVCGIVFFSYNIYSILNGKTDNFLAISMSKNSKGFNILGTLIDNTIKLEDSGITGSGYDFNTDYNPYYGLLNNKEKKVYKQIYANVLNYKDTFVPVEEIDIDSLVKVMEAVLNDHPELFWLSNAFSYKYNIDNICKQIIIGFNGAEKDKETFYKIADSIIEEAKKYRTDYEKELYVHDTLIRRIEYDETASNNQSAYSALVTGKTVCAGYARAFQYIMNRLGIPTYYVTGVSEGEDHAWNIVRLNDGYYNVDLTWDDQLNNSHTLFNRTDAEFNESHQRSSMSKKIFKCNADNFTFSKMSRLKEEEYIYQHS